MPISATRHTDAGARAFAIFFEKTIDWGYAITSSAYMDHYFQPSCTECRNAHTYLETARKRGWHYIGGRVHISGTEPGLLTRGPAGAERGVVVHMNIDAVTWVDKHGKFVGADVPYPHYTDDVYVAWHQHAWTVVSLIGTKS